MTEPVAQNAEPTPAPDAEPFTLPGARFGLFVGGLILGAALVGAAPLAWSWLGPLPEGPAPGAVGAPHAGHDHGSGSADEDADDPVWTCPMHPFVVSDQAGACPVCGMDLVLRVSSTGMDPAALAALGRVAISPVERVLANVATVPVGRTDLSAEVRAFGRMVYDETSYATIPAWVTGRIEALHVEETGVDVERGQRLLSIYSPELLAAQEEYLVILRSGGLSEGLLDSAERRLHLLGMSRSQIRRLAERGETSDTMTVHAPAAGTITERLVQQGEYVREGQPLFRLAGDRNIWVEADVFERDVAYVREGMPAEVELEAFPGERFAGIVTLVWPFLDEDTRTLRARVELESVDDRFRAGMYATVHLAAEAVHDAVAVPVEAVIRTGERAAVYVEIEENLFERREVQLGYRSAGLFEVREGLEPGVEVVARGGFLIDSEAQLYSGGHNLHFGHVAEEQGTTHLLAQAPVEVPVGRWFCPTDPSEQADGPARCSANNIQMIQRTEGMELPVDPDPMGYVHDGEWYCPMGAEWVAETEGSCPVCGMFLVPKPAADAAEP
jgi:Cu(I)/Ag(I) efflux system membrane fusion protein